MCESTTNTDTCKMNTAHESAPAEQVLRPKGAYTYNIYIYT